MVFSDRDSSPKCVCGPIFTSYLIGESPIVLALGFKLGLGISQQTRILNGIQFTRHFIEFVVVKTQRFISSTVNVILMRHTCGQRSSMSAESKHQALALFFWLQICHMFPISKCRGQLDLGLCTTSVLAKRTPWSIGKFWQILQPTRFEITFQNGQGECARVPELSVCTLHGCTLPAIVFECLLAVLQRRMQLIVSNLCLPIHAHTYPHIHKHTISHGTILQRHLPPKPMAFASTTKGICQWIFVKNVIQAQPHGSKTQIVLYQECGCEGDVVSASCRLHPPRNGSTGQVPLQEHETFSRTVLETRNFFQFFHDSPRMCKMFSNNRKS